jgi:hypothetical protein
MLVVPVVGLAVVPVEGFTVVGDVRTAPPGSVVSDEPMSPPPLSPPSPSSSVVLVEPVEATSFEGLSAAPKATPPIPMSASTIANAVSTVGRRDGDAPELDCIAES